MTSFCSLPTSSKRLESVWRSPTRRNGCPFRRACFGASVVPSRLCRTVSRATGTACGSCATCGCRVCNTAMPWLVTSAAGALSLRQIGFMHTTCCPMASWRELWRIGSTGPTLSRCAKVTCASGNNCTSAARLCGHSIRCCAVHRPCLHPVPRLQPNSPSAASTQPCCRTE